MKKKIRKPFDAEAAKRGAKVVTRSGHSARIICYDRVGNTYSIVALVNRGDIETSEYYTNTGRYYYGGKASEDDLFIIEEVEWTKFNVGDWLFREADGDRPWLITAITSDCYEIQDIQGQQKAKVYQTTVDKFYRLWTLKDAKPGEVLIYEDDHHPFIFKELVNGALTAYCGIDALGSIFISTDGRPMWTRIPVRPATYKEKQQFFNRLEEEGYKWDARTLTLWKKM